MGSRRAAGHTRRRHRPRAAGGRPPDLLRPARHHRLVPADLHPRGHGGPPVQAPGLHQDLFDGLCGPPRGDPDPGAGDVVHPGPHPPGARAPGIAVPRPGLCTRGAVRGPAPALGGARRGVDAGLDDPRVPSIGQRVHAAAQRGHLAVHADRAPGDVRHRGRGGPAANGPPAAQGPRGRDGVREDRPTRRRSRWSRRSCPSSPRASGGGA